MKTYLECYPYFMTQTITACKMLHLNEADFNNIINKVSLLFPSLDSKGTPPEIGKLIY